MVADALKSLSITNLDASPVVVNTAGAGAAGNLRNLSDYVTPTTGGLGSTSSKYKMIRLPMSAKLKALDLYADGALDSSTGLVFDVGAYYSDSAIDGTPAALQGTAIGVASFASQNAGFKSSAVAKQDVLTAFTTVMRNQPLWKALGFATNPGGFVDVVVAVHTVATTAASANLGINAAFVAE